MEFPNLTVTLPESHAKEWIDWHEDFVIKGNSSQDKELSGALVFLSADRQTELARVSFFNVGIYQVSFQSSAGGGRACPGTSQPVLRPDGVPFRRIGGEGLQVY